MKKTLLKLVSRLIGFKAFNLNGKHIVLLNTPMIAIPVNAFAQFMHEIILRNDREIIVKKLYELGKLQGNYGTSMYVTQFKINVDPSDLSFFLEQAKFIGFGNLIVQKSDINKIELILQVKSPLASAYNALFPESKESVDYFYAGLVAGAGGIPFKSNLIVKEFECISSGHPLCLFDLKSEPEKKLSDEIEKIKDKYAYNYLVDKIYDDKQVKYPSDRLIGKYGRNPFSVTDDGLILYNQKNIIIPIMQIVFFNKLFDANLIYKMGSFHGFETSNHFIKELGLNPDEHSLQLLISLIGLYGLGKLELSRINIKSKSFIFTVSENPIPKQYVKAFSTEIKCIDDYLAGYISGCIKACLKFDIKIKESECVVQGKSKCVFTSE